MSTPDFQTLDTLTRDYAAFQSRKSGLATALGGLMALPMFPLIKVSKRFLSGLSFRLFIAGLFLMPILWILAKAVLSQRLYHGLGEVKANPDPSAEALRWQWIFGLAFALLAFQTLALFGFMDGVLGFILSPSRLGQFPPHLPSRWRPWLWTLWMPCLYLLAAPLAIRGIEEARAYTVLAGQGVILLVMGFAWDGMNYPSGLKPWLTALYMGAEGFILLWSVLAIRRGWLEHRAFKHILQSVSCGGAQL
jgi:hypothetical protein